VILIYFAFKKVDLIKLFNDIRNVPFWFVILNIFLSFSIVVLISIRWSLLLFPKIKIRTVLIFTRANFLANFYSLFFPTAVVGEVAKWIVIDNKYPEIPKTKVLGSVILDRFIAFSLLMLIGFVSLIIGRSNGLLISDYIFYLFVILMMVCVFIYVLIYFFDISKLLNKITFLHKFDAAFDFLKDKNKRQITKCLLVSILSEFAWLCQTWLIGWKFGTNLSFLSIFVFIPIISIILILPISIGGFGAREQLYLFFFSQIGSSNESILLMSAFLGILGVINSLFGGFLSFFDQETRHKIIDRRL
jgi:uncharacterized protein (TIRG00374 family)